MITPLAVIFDMDGTLVDTERVSQTAWRRAAQDVGIQIPERILNAFVGCSMPNARAMINEEFGDEALTDRLFAHQAELFFKLEDEELEMRPGAYEAVSSIAAAGITVALATSTAREHALPLMERFRLAPFFSAMVFGDQIEHAKPAPDIYMETARRLGANPSRCAAVEDSNNGVRAALAAGMTTYMVPERIEPEPDVQAGCAAVVESLAEVAALVLSGAAGAEAEQATASVAEKSGKAARATAPQNGLASAGGRTPARRAATAKTAPRRNDPFIRAENEDDDGYDPYSDRLPEPEPLFERDPWS